MTVANIRYISNGYIVGANVPTAPALQSVYALTIPEVVYWLGRIFDPITGATAVALSADTDIEREIERLTQLQERLQTGAPAPHIIEPADDPLLGQRANVEEIASGGFLVTQIAAPGSGAQFVEVYCATMDAVSDTLTQIFTPPAPPPEELEAPAPPTTPETPAASSE
jgi:hypothetical protein